MLIKELHGGIIWNDDEAPPIIYIWHWNKLCEFSVADLFLLRSCWGLLVCSSVFVFSSPVLFLAVFPKHMPVYSWERQSIPEIGRGI